MVNNWSNNMLKWLRTQLSTTMIRSNFRPCSANKSVPNDQYPPLIIILFDPF